MLKFFFLLNINWSSIWINMLKRIFKQKILFSYNFNVFNLLKPNKKIFIEYKDNRLAYMSRFNRNHILRITSFLYINSANTQIFVFNFNTFCNKVLMNFNFINVIYYLYFFKNIQILYNYFYFMRYKKKIIIGVGIDAYIIKYLVRLNLVFVDLFWFHQSNYIVFYLINYFFFLKKNFIFFNTK